MEWIIAHQAHIWSAGLVVFGAFVTRLLRLRPKLVYSVGHSWNMLVDQPFIDAEGKEIAKTQVVRNASIIVGNAGLQPAKKVEITFNWKPPIYNVWPARELITVTTDFGRYSMKRDSLAPSEHMTIEIMSINQDLPLLTTVRSEDCVGKLIAMTPQRVWPMWLLRLIGALMLIGCGAIVYLVVSFFGFWR